MTQPPPDDLFALPRLAAVYDALDGARDDLDHHVAIVAELGAGSVIDLGCGTGCLAVLLAERGLDVTGVDPAAASLDVARRKPGADAVRWVLGDATALPPQRVDVVTMTGNVAQVFVTDDAWAETLAGVHGALLPGGHLVFETRRPEQRAWERWDRPRTWQRVDVPGVGAVRHWVEVLAVRPPLVTFRQTYEFEADGATLTSDSTLRFRSADELVAELTTAGFTVEDVRDAPDRPGLELVVIARRADERDT